MPVRDGANNQRVVIAMDANITTNGTTTGAAVDISHFDSGVMFFIDLPVYADGDYDANLDESPDGLSWSQVPAEKLIRPDGLLFFSAATSALDKLPRLGCFSTESFVRLSVGSIGITEGARVRGYAVEMGELRPSF